MKEANEWEMRCRRCGRCCYEKIEFEGEIYYTDTPCNFLDPLTRRCRVYSRRRTERPDCAALTPEVVRQGFLPGDCPYVAEIDGYVPPHPWPEETED